MFRWLSLLFCGRRRTGERPSERAHADADAPAQARDRAHSQDAQDAGIAGLFPNCTPDNQKGLRVDEPWPPKRLAVRLVLESGSHTMAQVRDNGDVDLKIFNGPHAGLYRIPRLENFDAIGVGDLPIFKHDNES